MKLLNQSIKVLFACLFLITPLILCFSNSELFEIPKMHFIYLITILTTTLHLINWSLGQIKLFHKNKLNWFLIIFLISQIICTITSIDIYTSLHGYYSRLNGGLFSLIAFSSIFLILPLYLNDKFKNTLINLILLSGFFVAIFGILEHFGIDKNFWVQDVQSRVFSTLGQPNWLAAYLCLLLPFSIYKFQNSINKFSATSYLLLTTIYYLTLLFTKSKSGILAAVISLTIFFIFTFFQKKSLKKSLIINYSLLIVLSLLISNPIKDFLFPHKLDIRNSTLEINNLNVTSSGNIRKIVWLGSWELFKKFPLVGTGVETFAYSYYWTRPIEHNLTSEWDFLYNKAHNEYLNYLATTGLVGTIPYLLFILAVLIVLIKKILNTKYLILDIAILCSFISILITNTAGFSISIVSLFFFTLPLFSFKYQEDQSHFKTKKILIPLVLFFSFYSLNQLIRSYFADVYFSKSQTKDNHQDYETAYQLISQTNQLKPKEPNYYIHLGLLSAKMALLTNDQKYIDQAIKYADLSVTSSPANINFWKLRSQVYYYLSSLDQKYFTKTIESMLQASKFAPTDAKIYFNLGQFLETASFIDEAIIYYQQAIDVKSNYDHAYFALGQIYFDQKKYDLAKTNLEQTLKYAPTNTAAQKLLDKIKKLKN